MLFLICKKNKCKSHLTFAALQKKNVRFKALICTTADSESIVRVIGYQTNYFIFLLRSARERERLEYEIAFPLDSLSIVLH